jgi:uncharacterized protein (UPF0332 family)
VNEDIEALVLYRLEQADESLESAQLLLDYRKYRPCVSRSYYAMFYAILALLAKKRHATSKHSGAIAAFNREFVKKGVFKRSFSLVAGGIRFKATSRLQGDAYRLK